ncbi:Protein phosphatase [Meloidogyne graminicola]|uniref:Protein phosphatase n=1 Tax=Meloidogyne graminicola TaxID=189291 RepID=A0A8T0A362_9BILA|nr:Protein phosphatase [Meloidogyne graminicola]
MVKLRKTLLEEERLQNRNKEQQQWIVNVTKCGIAKEFQGSQNEALQQQKQWERGVYGDDACFIAHHEHTYVAGIADGVGGWKRHGIDPSQFSSQLMSNCAEIVRSGDFEHSRPDLIIKQAYNKLKMLNNKKPIGSSTACVLTITKRRLYSANLGDSGYLICRGGEIIFRSPEQTHYFNAPYQLSILPEQMLKEKKSFLLDKPESSELREHELQSGDIVLIASDGLWDNCHISTIAKLLYSEEDNIKQKTEEEGEEGQQNRSLQMSHASLQARCNSLALIARHLSADEHYISPFTQRALKHGIRAPGGKSDDVTIILFQVT